MERDLLKGNVATLILAVLRAAPLHGYGIAREIERMSDGVLVLNEGALYPALHRLEEDGRIRGTWSADDNCRRRRIYTLTPEGSAVLDNRMQSWSTFANAVDRVLSGDDSRCSTRATRTVFRSGGWPGCARRCERWVQCTARLGWSTTTSRPSIARIAKETTEIRSEF